MVERVVQLRIDALRMLSVSLHDIPICLALTGSDCSMTSRFASWHAPALVLLLVGALLLAACGGASAPSATIHRPTATTGTVARPTVSYVALGASDAVGVGADNPNTQGYVPIIISRLPKGSAALNLGVSGITLHDALKQELPEVAAAQPTFITVWLVGNDFRDCTSLQQYAADLDVLLATLHDQTHAQVFVANTPDMSFLPYFQEGAPQGGACVQGASAAKVHGLVLQWNQVINPIVTKHGDVLVDLYGTDFANHPEYVSSRDGFHPSNLGYAHLADLFWSQVLAHKAVPVA